MLKRGKDPYDIQSEIEDFHWWFVVRKKLLKKILLSFRLPPESIAVDIGCGTGSNLRILGLSVHSVIGLDRSIHALYLTRKKVRFPVINGDLNELPFKNESIGLIIATDVLEHLENDLNGINEFYRTLRNGGMLVLTVPAFGFLWGIQDLVTGHKRRYSQKEILIKLRECGFRVLRASYFNFFLFFPILLARRIMSLLKLKVESENEINFPLLNFFLKAIFSLEPYVLKYFSFPFGVSILCVAKRNEAKCVK